MIQLTKDCNSSLILQTIITAQMLSTGGEGPLQTLKVIFPANKDTNSLKHKQTDQQTDRSGCIYMEFSIPVLNCRPANWPTIDIM